MSVYWPKYSTLTEIVKVKFQKKINKKKKKKYGMLPFSGNPSHEEINLHMVICMYNFVMCMVDIQITFLVNVPFQNSLKTSVSLLIA